MKSFEAEKPGKTSDLSARGEELDKKTQRKGGAKNKKVRGGGEIGVLELHNTKTGKKNQGCKWKHGIIPKEQR